jgi:mRNA interferase MazF
MDLVFERGEVVVCAVNGDYGKPRPAVVVQSDLFNPTHASITVCPITTCLVDAPLFRLSLSPTQRNGLKKSSQVMIDKITTLPRDKIRQRVGALTTVQLEKINQAIKIWLNLNSI